MKNVTHALSRFFDFFLQSQKVCLALLMLLSALYVFNGVAGAPAKTETSDSIACILVFNAGFRPQPFGYHFPPGREHLAPDYERTEEFVEGAAKAVDDRFYVKTIPSKTNWSVKDLEITDSTTGRWHRINEVPKRSSIKFSDSGDFLLISENGYDDQSRKHVWTQHLVDTSQIWRPRRVKSLNDIASRDNTSWSKLNAIKWQGYLVAADKQLRQFIMDITHGNAIDRGPESQATYPHQEPKLRRVLFDGTVKWQSLHGWQDYWKQLKQAAQRDLIVKHGALTGEFSPNGEHFYLHIEMNSYFVRPIAINFSYRHEFTQNLIVVWKSQPNRIVSIRNSRDLNTDEDRDEASRLEIPPNTRYREMVWKRQFKVRWMGNDGLVMVRGLIPEYYLDPNRIVAKAGYLNVRKNQLIVEAYEVRNVELDAIKKRAQWIGISSLNLTSSGHAHLDVMSHGLLGFKIKDWSELTFE